MNNRKRLGVFIGVLVLTRFLGADVHVEPGVCSVDDTIKLKNNGQQTGWFEMNYSTTPENPVDVSVVLVNKNNPHKKLYFGFGPFLRIEQIFQGEQEIECWRCHGGTTGKDPNFGDPCKNPLDANICITCITKIPCKDVIKIPRCQSSGGDARWNPQTGDPESLIKRIGLTQQYGKLQAPQKKGGT